MMDAGGSADLPERFFAERPQAAFRSSPRAALRKRNAAAAGLAFYTDNAKGARGSFSVISLVAKGQALPYLFFL